MNSSWLGSDLSTGYASRIRTPLLRCAADCRIQEPVLNAHAAVSPCDERTYNRPHLALVHRLHDSRTRQLGVVCARTEADPPGWRPVHVPQQARNDAAAHEL